MRRTLLASLATVAALTAACGGTGAGNDTDTSTKTIPITFAGDSVTPNAEVVKVGVGQPVKLDVTADTPGQLHVHSSPAHTFDYKTGKTSITFAIDRPGVVDIESHNLNEIVVKLQVQ